MKESILKYWREKPLFCILFLAGFFRLLAVLFSKGYGMHDDHFLVIEAAQSWADGYDYNKWIPQITKGLETPSGHSLLYPGFHYFLFKFLELLGMTDPQSKMYVVRLLHALLSMSIVYLGYRIAEKISGSKPAKTTGLILALLFFMPMFSVRNLVEFVCIPPMLYATWLVMKYEDGKKNSALIISGVMLALSLSIRFQTTVFIGGFYLVLLLQKKWKEIFLSALGFILCIALVQGITDIIIWKRPFAEIGEYVRYNMEHANEYIIQKWYNYIILLAGILIPPISIFILFGYLRHWKKQLLLFLPAFIFLVFHSYLPSKQERFILPIIPFIITLGVCGWTDFVAQSSFWQRNQKLLRACWIFFWSVNFIPLLFISTAYSHRSRVEAMTYLSKKKDFKNFIIEESQHDGYNMPPRFYLQHWVYQASLTKNSSLEQLAENTKAAPDSLKANYVVFNEEENIEERVQNFKKYFPGLEYETTIEPGLVDKVMHKLNKRNANFTSYIYRIPTTKDENTAPLPSQLNLSQQSPDSFIVEFKTTKGNFLITAHRAWSPLACDRLYLLVKNNWYDNTVIYRVAPTRSYKGGKIVQFGVSNNPAANYAWRNAGIKDEPVVHPHEWGAICFARDSINSRSTDIAISLAPGTQLDTVNYKGVIGFPTFALVTDGMDVLQSFNGEYGNSIVELPDDSLFLGRAFFDRKYPGLDRIISAAVVKSWIGGKEN